MPVRALFTPDGLRALVSSWAERGELIVLDATSDAELARLPVGRRAIGMEISPDARRAFVGCEYDDGVHVVDLQALTVTGRFFTGSGSDAIAWWRAA
jgi:DNA-binding beta-propeller fold protein YncE